MSFKRSTITTVGDKLGWVVPVGVSDLGTLLIDSVKFQGKKFRTLQGAEIQVDSFEIVDARVRVSRGKNIVQNTINGVDGTIKEYINARDYEINITGSISSITGFPAERWKQFVELQQVPEQIRVTSKFLNSLFGINFVVIEDFDAVQAGSINSYNVNIDCLSDEVVDLTKFLESGSVNGVDVDQDTQNFA